MKLDAIVRRFSCYKIGFTFNKKKNTKEKRKHRYQELNQKSFCLLTELGALSNYTINLVY